MTRIAKIRYYQGRVAYPSAEQLRHAWLRMDLDPEDDGNRPTEDTNCTHIHRIEISGPDAATARSREKKRLGRFFDYIGYKRGFRVLTHETKTNSDRGAVTMIHDIVYVIESRPTKGYVKLTLKSDVPHKATAEEKTASTKNTLDMYDQLQRFLAQPKKRPKKM